MTADNSINDKIVADVGRSYGWKPGDTRVATDDALSNDSCTFYRAVNASLPDAGMITYAKLPGGKLAGGTDQLQAAADVLRACGRDASAEWWLHVISRFAGDANGRLVRADDRLSIGLIDAAGGTYREPLLTRQGETAQLRFFVIRRMTEPALVKAILPAKGPLSVEVEPIKRQ